MHTQSLQHVDSEIWCQQDDVWSLKGLPVKFSIHQTGNRKIFYLLDRKKEIW